jgi:hypothetical protein
MAARNRHMAERSIAFARQAEKNIVLLQTGARHVAGWLGCSYDEEAPSFQNIMPVAESLCAEFRRRAVPAMGVVLSDADFRPSVGEHHFRQAGFDILIAREMSMRAFESENPEIMEMESDYTHDLFAEAGLGREFGDAAEFFLRQAQCRADVAKAFARWRKKFLGAAPA